MFLRSVYLHSSLHACTDLRLCSQLYFLLIAIFLLKTWQTEMRNPTYLPSLIVCWCKTIPCGFSFTAILGPLLGAPNVWCVGFHPSLGGGASSVNCFSLKQKSPLGVALVVLPICQQILSLRKINTHLWWSVPQFTLIIKFCLLCREIGEKNCYVERHMCLLAWPWPGIWI